MLPTLDPTLCFPLSRPVRKTCTLQIRSFGTMATPLETMDLGDSILFAASRLPSIMQPSRQLCQAICGTIMAGFDYSFGTNPRTLWAYFDPNLEQSRADKVAIATRQLLSCKAFTAHLASDADPRIRPTLVAGATAHASAENVYEFIVETSLCSCKVSK